MDLNPYLDNDGALNVAYVCPPCKFAKIVGYRVNENDFFDFPNAHCPHCLNVMAGDIMQPPLVKEGIRNGTD